jgi:hypothetical protein
MGTWAPGQKATTKSNNQQQKETAAIQNRTRKQNTVLNHKAEINNKANEPEQREITGNLNRTGDLEKLQTKSKARRMGWGWTMAVPGDREMIIPLIMSSKMILARCREGFQWLCLASFWRSQMIEMPWKKRVAAHFLP